MVLDVKVMSWAGQHGLDTAKLKAARVPIYGKWYYPELPADTPLINLATGERATFPAGMLAGEIAWVAERDLKKARLGPFANITDEELAELDRPPVEDLPEGTLEERTGVQVETDGLEPYLALARVPPPPLQRERGPLMEPRTPSAALADARPADAPPIYDTDEPANIHLPNPSIAPLVLAFGISIAAVGVVVHPFVLVVGLIWCLVGAIAWIRIGLIEARAAGYERH